MNPLEDESSRRGGGWLPLADLSVAQLPELGSCAGAYAFRDAGSKEILYIGSTDCLRRRLLGNYVGGVGGDTTKRVNALLFGAGMIMGIEVRVFPSTRHVDLEKELKVAYTADHGRLPKWVVR
jgi:excinuclease UvrABC nuclease subunit